MSGSLKGIIGVGVATVVLVVGLVWLGSRTIPQTLDPITDGEAQLTRDYSPTIGATGAAVKVTLVEFADFQCPACAASAPILRELVSANPDVQLVFRHFPLEQHLNAEPAAKAAEAANVQGKFWEFYDRMFERQSAWSVESDPASTFESYAQELGLNLEQFRADQERSELFDHIRLDLGEALALGVNSTPSIFINGTLYEGARDLKSLQAAIDQARP